MYNRDKGYIVSRDKKNAGIANTNKQLVEKSNDGAGENDSPFSYLPSEIIEGIFAFLPNEHLDAAGRVCKRWQAHIPYGRYWFFRLNPASQDNLQQQVQKKVEGQKSEELQVPIKQEDLQKKAQALAHNDYQMLHNMWRNMQQSQKKKGSLAPKYVLFRVLSDNDMTLALQMFKEIKIDVNTLFSMDDCWERENGEVFKDDKLVNALHFAAYHGNQRFVYHLIVMGAMALPIKSIRSGVQPQSVFELANVQSSTPIASLLHLSRMQRALLKIKSLAEPNELGKPTLGEVEEKAVNLMKHFYRSCQADFDTASTYINELLERKHAGSSIFADQMIEKLNATTSGPIRALLFMLLIDRTLVLRGDVLEKLRNLPKDENLKNTLIKYEKKLADFLNKILDEDQDQMFSDYIHRMETDSRGCKISGITPALKTFFKELHNSLVEERKANNKNKCYSINHK